jgi:sirohydrochlorin cobaltochelatase
MHDHCHHHGHEHHHGHSTPVPFGTELCREDGRRDVASTGIILAAFGATSDAARSGLDAVMEAVRSDYPETEVMMAYTSLKVRRHLKRKGLPAPCPASALSEMRDMGVPRAVVQPLHTVPGIEYEFVRAQAESFIHPRKGFLDVRVGTPLLHSPSDMEAATAALETYLPGDLAKDEAVLLVGHGTPHPAQSRYVEFESLARRVCPRLTLCLLTGRPGLDEAASALRTFEAKRVRIVPFMSVAGHHVSKDLAGNGEDSWATLLRNMGFNVSVNISGTAAHPPFAAIWREHLASALAQLKTI